MKTCAKCQEQKPSTEYRWVKAYDRLHSYCNACNRAIDRARKDQQNLNAKVWLASNPDRAEARRAAARERYHSRPDVRARTREQASQWYRENPERRLETHLLRKYKITLAEYQALVGAQGGRCRICETALPEGKGRAVDHCHSTQKVRGILCSRCNMAIGLFDEKPEVLARAAAYLEAHGHDLV